MTGISPPPRIRLSRLRVIGWTLWDPIGIMGPSGAAAHTAEDSHGLPYADEYDGYLIAAASQLRRGASRESVVEYLADIEVRHMALGEREDTRERARSVVEAILADEALWSAPEGPSGAG